MGSTLPRIARRMGTCDVVFPLTPALSLREWGFAETSLDCLNDPSISGHLATIPPLPKGDGWGEGEWTAPSTPRTRTRRNMGLTPTALGGFKLFINSSLWLCRRTALCC